MGRSEIDKTKKEPKVLPTPNNAQEPSSSTSTATANADWSGFQAYSPIPPHGYFGSSPQAHPYVWGVQPVMPPYGTPHPYVAMYPHGGMYAHPSMPPGSYPFGPFPVPSANGVADASGNIPGGAEADAKVSGGKEKLPIKRSKVSLGSLNMTTCTSNEEGKTTGPSDASSKSAESASDGTSEGSNADSHNDSPTKSGERQEAHEADTPHNGTTSAHMTQNGALNAPHTIVNHALTIVPMTAPGTPAPIPGPTTNLNIGMDYWGVPASSAMTAIPGTVPTGSRDNLKSQLWLQDERELKRQRRKQSNRESARRSRLRKQAEYDELAQHAESLKEENANLRSQLNHIRSEYEKLFAENSSLKERLGGASEDLGSSQR